LKKKEQIITKIKTKYWQTTHKFGIEIPKSVEHALLIDQQMGTNYWCKAIKKEMKNVRVAFQQWNRDGQGLDPSSLQGYQEIKCHMIFDIKMDGEFTRKADLLLAGILQRPQHLPPTQVLFQERVSEWLSFLQR